MPYSFWEGIAETPWWIYWMFLCFFYFAYLTTKPRIIFLKSALISESIFVAFLWIFVIYVTQFNLTNVLLFLAALCLGALIGWLQFRYSGVKAIKNKMQFYLPGSWNFFIFLFLVLFIKYYFFGPRFIFDPVQLKQQSYYHQYVVLLGGLLTGLFIGRTSYGIQCFKHGPYIEEKDLPSSPPPPK